MKIISILDYTSFMIFLYLGFHVFRMDPRGSANRIFLVQCLSFALWALCDTFAMSSASVETVWMLERVSAFGYATFAVLVLHFFLVITGQKIVTLTWRFLFLLYLPALVFMVKGVTGPLAVADFVRTPYGWREVLPLDSPWYAAFSAYYILYMVASVSIAFYWLIKTKNRRQKIQARVLAISCAAPLLLGLVTDVILPQLHLDLPPLTPVLIVIWAVGVWYVIARYHFMALTPELAAGDIVRQMDNMVFFLTETGHVTRVNDQVENLLGCCNHDLHGTHFSAMVVENDRFDDMINAVVQSREERVADELNLIFHQAEAIPARLFCTAVLDRNGLIIGVLVVGIDLRETRELQKEIAGRIRAQKLLEKSETALRQRNEEIERDLANAQLIERALFRPEPLNIPGLAVMYRHLSMDMIGGDYFTSFPLTADTGALFISDVSGHGISASLFLSLISSAVHRIGKVQGLDPSLFMKNLNDELIEYMSSYFITAVYGTVRLRDERLIFSFARGGHTHPLVVSSKEKTCFPVKTRGSMVGQFPGAEFESGLVELLPGDRIFLYTDGLVEARNGAGELYGFDRFTRLLLSCLDKPLHAALDWMVDQVRSFAGRGELDDDMLVVGIEFHGNGYRD